MVSLRQAAIYGMVFTSATLIGYDSGYLNGVLGSPDFIRRYGVTDREDGTMYLAPRTKSLFTSLLVIGTLIGSMLAMFKSDRIGRKGSFFLAAILYAIGASLQTAAPPPGVFILGRIFTGLALGLISIVSPSYLVESSTGTSRGRLVALYSQPLTGGNVIACGISLGTKHLAGANSWRITIAFQLILVLAVFLGALFAPESPVLLLQRTNPSAARHSLSILRNLPASSAAIDQALQEIQTSISERDSLGHPHLAEIFHGTDLRRTLLGTAMGFMTIATGITFWFGYGTTFFKAAGVQNAYLVSLILALVNAIFTGRSVDACLLWGGGIMGITQIVVAVIHTVSPDTAADHNSLIVCTVVFIAAYAATWGTVGWVTMTEPYSTRLRIHQTTITMVVYWLSTWAVGFVTPYIVDATAADLGVYISYVWFGMVVLSLAWAYVFVPELSGLSTPEIDLLFEDQVPAWKSVAWKRSLGSISIDGQELQKPVTEGSVSRGSIEKGKVDV
ncbi:glucose transporter [Aspergillus ellipticus CBS 707.79]|uniref:Glucose transporter n=1 Tax=Aspergillus ellipticus CBS 707.79 TaxID=1448320 RepID=A0A319DK60_9EURO|nr:glucose transporter [Aspergillus ellipticus CBS 707.79]